MVCRTLGLVALWVISPGCSGAVDTSAAAEDTCAPGSEATTWDAWGAGFFAGYCRTCHSADTPDRRGAPESLNFDTEAEVRASAGLIQSSVIDEGTMPIGGGVPDVELQRLAQYLGCSP